MVVETVPVQLAPTALTCHLQKKLPRTKLLTVPHVQKVMKTMMASVLVGAGWISSLNYVLVSTAGYEDNDRVCIGRCWLNLITQTMY